MLHDNERALGWLCELLYAVNGQHAFGFQSRHQVLR